MVSAVARSTAPLVADGSVTLHYPAAVLSTNAGTLAAPILRGSYIAGATSIVIDDGAGGGLQGNIPNGARVTIGATTYAASGARPATGGLSFTITPPLSAPATAGAPVTFSSLPETITNAVSVSANTARGREFFEAVSFAFQVHVDDLSVRPAPGTRCVRTTAAGETLTGTILDTSSGGVMVLVWCKGAVR